MKKLLTIVLMTFSLSLFAEDFSLQSPDKQITVKVKSTDKVYYSVDFKGENVLWFSAISMTLDGGKVLGQNPVIKSKSTRNVDGKIQTVWGTRAEITEQYNELTLDFEGNYSLIFRAYNDGVAYRFKTDINGQIQIIGEEANWRFLKNHALMAHVVGDFQTSYEKLYTKYKISDVVEKDFISLPLVMDQGNAKIAITESDVYDYPGMYIQRQGNNNRFDLQGIFPAYPTQWVPGGWCQFNLTVTERAEYIAKTYGKREFPWRVMIIADEDKKLADNDLVYKLARPVAIKTDWIKPGKVSWDWWNAWNLEGVDFETGINNKTYEHYIDFAAKNGLEYIIMDEGWSDQFDLFLSKPGIDVQALVEYGKKKNVKIILWCVWHPLDRQMEAAMDMFQKWGIAGLKVDFIDRDDQIAINFYERLVKAGAEHNLLIDIHGCSKPTGLHRTYPNLINYEAVRGNEYNKFATDETPGHNVDIVYTRMLAGPMDYTPGAMRNSTKGNFLTDNENPMSYGTRCHQLGMYVVYFAPLQMLCDAPTQYNKYPDILNFLSKVPVTWDESVPLAGKLGEYVAIARRKGNNWYIGALNDWTERTLELDLSFLGTGKYQAEMFVDGINANRKAEDYRMEKKEVTKSTKIPLTLKQGGGAAIVLRKQ
ncbi:MAG: glycoside hydrolase family 97 protein [Bacteroidia bacterium]